MLAVGSRCRTQSRSRSSSGPAAGGRSQPSAKKDRSHFHPPLLGFGSDHERSFVFLSNTTQIHSQIRNVSTKHSARAGHFDIAV